MLGFEVWFGNGCGPNRCFPSVFEVATNFHGENLAAFFPNFRGGNPIALRLRCVIAHQTLFSPSFLRENTEMGMPHFHGKNLTEVHIWCAMTHW